mmetsp:Transcript_13655/g.28991  ORF Transcript_13655/g.28991 Transcript_13655/m.28991 type:complete len:172 (+) Transcript_13655:228-743(+)
MTSSRLMMAVTNLDDLKLNQPRTQNDKGEADYCEPCSRESMRRSGSYYLRDCDETEREKNHLKKEKLERYLYTISCQTCQKKYCHIKGYMGVYNSTAAEYKSTMTTKLKEHYNQVWKLVQEENGGMQRCNDRGFASSSLALHIAKHCHGLETEGEVMEWCIGNLKVQIKRI